MHDELVTIAPRRPLFDDVRRVVDLKKIVGMISYSPTYRLEKALALSLLAAYIFLMLLGAVLLLFCYGSDLNDPACKRIVTTL